jgi:hypothetical protein
MKSCNAAEFAKSPKFRKNFQFSWSKSKLGKKKKEIEICLSLPIAGFLVDLLFYPEDGIIFFEKSDFISNYAVLQSRKTHSSINKYTNKYPRVIRNFIDCILYTSVSQLQTSSS